MNWIYDDEEEDGGSGEGKTHYPVTTGVVLAAVCNFSR